MNKKVIKNTVTIVSFIALFIIIWLNKNTFITGTKELGNAQVFYVVLAIIAALASVIPSAFAYFCLAPKPIRLHRIVTAQMANNFTGKILPAGTGDLATMARFLTTQSYNVIEASSIVSVNYLASFLGLMILTIISLILSGQSVTDILRLNISAAFYYVVLAIIGSLVLAAFIPSSSSIIRKKAREFWSVYLKAISRGWRFLLAIVASALLTLCLVFCLIFSVAAFGGNITIAQSLIVLTIGVAAAAITPTPGSVGGAELGIMLALQAAGLDSSVALPAALIYRFSRYWFPILPGFIAFQIAIKKHYL